MADRCSASITIGGKLAAADLPRLLTLISDEGLSTEFDGPKFELTELVSGEPLLLCAHEVSWARSLNWKPSAAPTNSPTPDGPVSALVYGGACVPFIAEQPKPERGMTPLMNMTSARTIRS
jgi:hypothetical protein